MSNAEASTTPSQTNGQGKTEWLLAAAIVCLLAAVAVPTIRHQPRPHVAVAPVMDLEGLLTLAREQAIATGESHLVYFESDSQGNQVTDDVGAPVLALVARDSNRDGRASPSEYVASVPVDPEAGVVGWGRSQAPRSANGDTGLRRAGGWSFTGPHGLASARWLMFGPDGMPRALSFETRLVGPPGSGAGALYAYSATDDYAVVLSPWGDVEVQHWNGDASRWQLAASR